jgi:hypothetical protein
MFSFNWLDMFKPWFTVLLASIVLYLWFEREHTHRRLDEMHGRMEVLQHRIMVTLHLRMFDWSFITYI